MKYQYNLSYDICEENIKSILYMLQYSAKVKSQIRSPVNLETNYNSLP